MDEEFGKIKVWQMNRSAKTLLIVTTNLNGLVWQMADDLPNSPNFLPVKHSHYMVICSFLVKTLHCSFLSNNNDDAATSSLTFCFKAVAWVHQYLPQTGNIIGTQIIVNRSINTFLKLAALFIPKQLKTLILSLSLIWSKFTDYSFQHFPKT